MTGLFAIMAIGFFLGMRHATDADHVLAVSTIVSKHRTMRHAAAIGAFWGVGHTLTILIVGGGIVLFGWVIPPRVGLSMEFSVGLMLIGLGILSVMSGLRHVADTRIEDVAPHTHRHGDYVHTHTAGDDGHPHSPERTPVAWLDRRLGRFAVYRPVRPMLVGMVHGMAGSAAVALLVMTAIRSPTAALLYLLVFGAGTIIGMMLITAVIAAPFAIGGKSVTVSRGLRVAAGVLSLGFGLLLVWQIGVVDGLFTGVPTAR
jgi:high-affinity nickel-transport protein